MILGKKVTQGTFSPASFCCYVQALGFCGFWFRVSRLGFGPGCVRVLGSGLCRDGSIRVFGFRVHGFVFVARGKLWVPAFGGIGLLTKDWCR